MTGATLANAVVAWAQGETSVEAINVIGSRVRPVGDPGAADAQSDWDFQFVVRRPALFADASWITTAGLPPPPAYVVRTGRLGSSGKVSIAFAEGAFDLVLIPAGALRMARWLCRLGLVNWSPRARSGLTDLALVLRSGHRLLKGGDEWARFFAYVQDAFPPARLSDDEVVALAAGFVCDFISTRDKIARGELLAAQRWLHMHLAEINFRLLHELRQRAGRPSFPDARRVEFLDEQRWLPSVTVRAHPDAASLVAAAEACAWAHCDLMQALVGPRWNWPAALALHPRRK